MSEPKLRRREKWARLWDSASLTLGSRDPLEGSPDSQVLRTSAEEDEETIVGVWVLVSARPSKSHSLTFTAPPLFPIVDVP